MQTAVFAADGATLHPLIPGTPINALVLDDSTFDRRRIRRLSKQTGLPIFLDEAGSIEAMRELLNIDQFDVILLDYRLPSGDGIEALEMVRNHPTNSHVPTIMVTGIEDPEVVVRAMRLGCSDFLAKDDITAQSLAQAVTAAIERSHLIEGSRDRKREITRHLSREIVTEFREALQPELAGIVRDLRAIRSMQGPGGTDLGAQLDRLEARCVSLWSALGLLGLAKSD